MTDKKEAEIYSNHPTYWSNIKHLSGNCIRFEAINLKDILHLVEEIREIISNTLEVL